jgi:hypothetical protein
MPYRFKILSLAAVLPLLGVFSVNGAFADSAANSATMTSRSAVPPLPQDPSNANRADPASPNCYPDLNHCASYASGNVTKANPLQQPQSQPAAQQGKKPQ